MFRLQRCRGLFQAIKVFTVGCLLIASHSRATNRDEILRKLQEQAAQAANQGQGVQSGQLRCPVQKCGHHQTRPASAPPVSAQELSSRTLMAPAPPTRPGRVPDKSQEAPSEEFLEVPQGRENAFNLSDYSCRSKVVETYMLCAEHALAVDSAISLRVGALKQQLPPDSSISDSAKILETEATAIQEVLGDLSRWCRDQLGICSESCRMKSQSIKEKLQQINPVCASGDAQFCEMRTGLVQVFRQNEEDFNSICSQAFQEILTSQDLEMLQMKALEARSRASGLAAQGD